VPHGYVAAVSCPLAVFGPILGCAGE